LKIAAHEALMELIENSPKDCYSVVKEAILKLQMKIPELMGLALVSAADGARLHDLVSQMCTTFKSVLRKLFDNDASSSVTF
jgi:hypothetical protein